MELNWSLKEIYPGFNSEEFKSDMIKLDNLIADLDKFASSIEESNEEIILKLEEYIKRNIDLNAVIHRLYAFINLSISTNTKDTDALKQSDILEGKIASTVASTTKIEKWISVIEGIESVIKKSKLLLEHSFVFKSILEKAKYLLSEKEESIIANMQNTGSIAWGKLKDNLISTQKVKLEVDGEIKELPLTVVLNMAYDKDRDVRKKAYEAEIESYKKTEEGVAAALNAIKGEVLTVSKLRGYKSPLEETLLKSRMDKESLEAMLSAMKDSMPKFREYLKRKAEILGHKNGLPFYDLYAPVVEADMKYSYQEAAKFIVKNFRTFSENLANFAQRAIDNSWIDVMPKEGKVGGAFCENLPFIGASRFLLNYGGNFSDVVTFAHELGHGFHGECLKDESILNTDYPMPLAETASIFCETIIKKSAIKYASKEEALAILEEEISGATQVIIDIYSRFLFESWLFEKREESALSVEEIKELMIKAQKEAYGDGLDPEHLHPYMWTWKPHYYYANANFYNFPYAFGLLFAKGLYSEYLKKGDAFPKEYEKLLSITGKNKIADVTNIMGIDIRNKEFWENSLKIIEKDIEEFIELTNK